MLALSRAAALGLAGGVALGAASMVKFVRDAEESRKVSRLTTAAIKSTGGAAKVTAKQVGDLATAISNKTGIDDEAIQSGENLLLTFTNVRNEVGRGNAIFDRATQTITNMSAALGQDTSASAIQLGKALNDPIKGVTALSRVGVSFTAQQKAQIKTLVDSGKTLDAQKLILRELGKEFGGAAVAASSPMQRLKTILDNLGETIGTAVLPFVDRAATAIGEFATGMQNGTGPGGRFADKVKAVGDRLGEIVTAIRTNVLPALTSLYDYVTNTVVPALHDLGTRIGPEVANTLSSISDSAKIIGDSFRTSGGDGRGFAKDLDKVEVSAGLLKAELKLISANVRALSLAFRASTVGPRFFADQLIKHFSGLVSALLGFFGQILHGAVVAFGWIKGIGGKLKNAEGAFSAFSASVRASLSGAQQIGQDWANGLAAGIRQGGEVAVATAQGVANKIAAATRAGLQTHSPSKIAIEIGGFFSQGLAIGIRKGGKKALDAVTELVQRVTDKLADTRSKIAAIRDSVGGAVRGVLDVGAIGQAIETTTQVTTPGTAGTTTIDPVTGRVTTTPGTDATTTDVTTSRTPSAAETVAGFAAQAQAFASALAQMAKKKLAPSIIAAVAAAGPVSGLTAAQALAQASASDVTAINSSMKSINQAAGQAANTAVRVTPLPAQEKREVDMLAEIRGLRADMAGKKVASLEITKGGDLIVKYVNDTNKKNERRG